MIANKRTVHLLKTSKSRAHLGRVAQTVKRLGPQTFVEREFKAYPPVRAFSFALGKETQ